MTAPTYTSIVEAITEGIHKMYCDGDCQCQDAMRLTYRNVAELIATASLRFLAPLVALYGAYAEANDALAESHEARGMESLAQRCYGSRDAHQAIAKQLRALMPKGESNE